MGGAHSPPLRGGVARQLNRSWRAGREARSRAKRKRDSAQPQEKGEASINGQFGEGFPPVRPPRLGCRFARRIPRCEEGNPNCAHKCWSIRDRMTTGSTNQSDGFALFTQAAERYCLGLTNSAMRSYALRYFTFLQAKAQGLKQEEPKNGRASSFDCVLIRSYLTKLYRDMVQDDVDQAA